MRDVAPVTSVSVDADDGLEEEGPLFPWLPPDDRLWRHPSEVVAKRARPFILRDTDHRLWTVALVAGLVGALLTSGAGVMTGEFSRTTTVVRPIEQIEQTSPYVTLSTDPRNDTIFDITQRLRPSVVQLLVDGDGANGSGSGVIFRSDGYILTNNHVVAGAVSVIAVMADGHRVNCRFVGGDPITDIAVLKMEGVPTQPVITLGSSTELKVGQLAIAIGSPLGLAGGPSVTSGIISAVDREVDPDSGPPLLDMIQTDDAIEPGSSGGALVDGNGMVVGITTTVAPSDEGTQNLGFATPIEVADDVANQILSTGKVVHAWLGLEGGDVDVDTAQQFDLTGGAVISSVDTDGPAARAGLAPADIVTAFAGQPVESMNELDMSIGQHRPGDRLSLTYLDDNGVTHTTSVVLLERPAEDYPS